MVLGGISKESLILVEIEHVDNNRYTFGADGSFKTSHGGDFWLETWHDGVDAEGCGTPVAP